jgi:purine-binding chemotaxis protein CheW
MDPHARLDLGGFVLGDMALALPMAALREVAPCASLHALPCALPAVIGGIELRGVMVPVLDLRLSLGQTRREVPHPCVVVMVHEGRILGLLADAVTGIFACEAAQLHPVRPSPGLPQPLFSASLQRADDATMISVLDPSTLMALPQVPLVADPEPARAAGATLQEAASAEDDPLRTLVLLRCGQVLLALDAGLVYTTVSDPAVMASALAGGHCLGVYEHAGVQVPVLDLHALCGLGGAAADARKQAFLVALPQGLVAFLVDAVLDVIGVKAGQLMRVPRFALPRADLFGEALPFNALSGDLQADLHGRIGRSEGQFLVLDGEGLLACEEVQCLAGANVNVIDGRTAKGPGQTGVPAGERSADAASQGRQDVITYVMGGETASPMAQVSEILPMQGCVPGPSSQGDMLGFLVNQGRSIPVLCLNRLVRGADTVREQGHADSACVLVVPWQDEWVGFAVPRLVAIETAVPMGQPSQGLARVGQGESERVLSMVDLHALAERVCAGAVSGTR